MKNNSELSPRHLYDCGHCRLAWCCGPLCACIPHLTSNPAPKQRAEYVKRLHSNWMKSRSKNRRVEEAHWIELAQRAKRRWAKKEGVKIS